MHDDRLFSPDPAQRTIARALYADIRALPLVCPHGHVNPRLLAHEPYTWGTPVDLLIIPDHYIFRMLYAHGIPLEALGIAPGDGGAFERDHRVIWRTVCDHWFLFRGTPTAIWLRAELRDVFGIDLPIDGAHADALYDQIADKLVQPAYQPRRLFERFGIEVLATTDAATDPLTAHQAIRDSGWGGRVIPTFRPDALVNLDTDGWRDHLDALRAATDMPIGDYAGFIAALEDRRAFFRSMGATATDHAALTAHTERLSDAEAEAIFARALRGEITPGDAARFTGHMLFEMARMSSQDGMVMQMHIGSYRNHHPSLYARFGRDMGADIPVSGEFTRALRPLLSAFGAHPNLTLILFTLDEATYSRELAPLAGHYPALKLGPPWWFFDSLNGMRRFFDAVMETAGVYNTVGFNDDTRAYPSIPARHDVWRRASADWLAGLVVRGIVDEGEAHAMAHDLAYRLAREAYRLG